MRPDSVLARAAVKQAEEKEYARDKAGHFMDLTNGKSKAAGTTGVPSRGRPPQPPAKYNHKTRLGGKPRQRPQPYSPLAALALTNAIAGASRHPDRACVSDDNFRHCSSGSLCCLCLAFDAKLLLGSAGAASIVASPPFGIRARMCAYVCVLWCCVCLCAAVYLAWWVCRDRPRRCRG